MEMLQWRQRTNKLSQQKLWDWVKQFCPILASLNHFRTPVSFLPREPHHFDLLYLSSSLQQHLDHRRQGQSESVVWKKPHLFSDWRIQEGMCGGDKETRKTYGELSLLYQVICSVQITKGRSSYTLKCRWLKKTKAFEIVADPPGKAFLGVNNLRIKRTNPDEEIVDIKRHIRHADTYR